MPSKSSDGQRDQEKEPEMSSLGTEPPVSADFARLQGRLIQALGVARRNGRGGILLPPILSRALDDLDGIVRRLGDAARSAEAERTEEHQPVPTLLEPPVYSKEGYMTLWRVPRSWRSKGVLVEVGHSDDRCGVAVGVAELDNYLTPDEARVLAHCLLAAADMAEEGRA